MPSTATRRERARTLASIPTYVPVGEHKHTRGVKRVHSLAAGWRPVDDEAAAGPANPPGNEGTEAEDSACTQALDKTLRSASHSRIEAGRCSVSVVNRT